MSDEGSRRLVVARPSADPPLALSIVVPAYDEAFRVPVVIEALRHHVDPATTEILIVDDGSTDDTADVARGAVEWAEHSAVLSHPRNLGKGAAVRTGVAASRGEVVAFFDADNATSLASLDAMIAALDGPVGAVFGSRHAPGATVTGSPAIRGLMGRVFNHVVQKAAGTSIRDTQCGAKAFRGPAARAVFGMSEVDGFAFDVEILRLLLMAGFDVIEHPVDWHYVHGTKIKALTPLRMLADIARIRLRKSIAPIDYLDTEWNEALAGRADPLYATESPAVGEPVRLLLPPDGASGQSRTWDQLIGTSAS